MFKKRQNCRSNGHTFCRAYRSRMGGVIFLSYISYIGFPIFYYFLYDFAVSIHSNAVLLFNTPTITVLFRTKL